MVLFPDSPAPERRAKERYKSQGMWEEEGGQISPDSTGIINSISQ